MFPKNPSPNKPQKEQLTGLKITKGDMLITLES